MPKINFTKTAIERLPLPQKAWVFYTDEKTPNLTLGVGPSGIKTFYLYKRVPGQDSPERIKIGRFPEFSVEMARSHAMVLHGMFAKGQNPAEIKRAGRAELTLHELFQEYVRLYAIPHGIKTIEAQSQLFNVYLGKNDGPRKKHARERSKPEGSVDWSAKPISNISHDDVIRLHHRLGEGAGKVVANRVIELLRAVFNRCTRLRLISLPNPAEGIEPYKEVSRDRFLKPDEIPNFFKALESESQDNRDFFLIALLTGARKSNVLAMKWEDLDLKTGSWRVPGELSKNGQPMVIPLTNPALEILAERSKTKSNTFVFSGKGQSGHMTSPKRAWQRIVARAGLSDIRPHDLRRSLGSWMVNTGASLAIVGGTLGHKDSKSTEVYARLAIDPIKDAMAKAQDAMFNMLKTKIN